MGLFTGLSNAFGFNKNFNHFGVDIFGATSFRGLKGQKLLELVMENPAMVNVIALQCDMFSMAKFYYYVNEREQKIPEELQRILDKPNYEANIKQFLWDWMFWNMLGNSWIYVRDKNFDSRKMFVLNSLEMDFPSSFENRGLIFSEKKYKEYQDQIITYNQIGSSSLKIKRKDLIHFTDLTNSPTGEVNGFSRLDSLYKIIKNSEEDLKAKNINTRFSGKFLVAGKNDVSEVSKRLLSTKEKDDIETKVETGKQQVHAIKSMIEIRRFVENMKQMELGKAYLDDFFLIGKIYNIPRDVLELYASSKYENQEKARAMHVSYTLDPKGQELGKGISDFFGLEGTLVLSWDHLNFVQILEGDREDTKKKKLENLEKVLKLGLDPKEALEFVDLKFKKFNYEKPSEGTQGQNGEGNQPAAEESDSGENQ